MENNNTFQYVMLLPLYLLPLAFALYIITRHFLHKLKNHPPSPILNLPILGHLYLLKKPPLQRSLAKLSDRLGPVLLLHFGSRPVLIVSSPSAAEECLGKNDVVFANRPRLLAGKHIGYNYTSLAWTSYGEHWRNLRRIASVEILSTQRLQMLHDARVEEVRDMLCRVHKAATASSSSCVDMKKMLFEMMLNIMMRMIAGKRYFGDDVHDDAGQAARFREIVVETFKIAGVTSMGDFLPVVGKIFAGGIENRMIKLQEKRDALIQELIEECKRRIAEESTGHENINKKKSLIQVMLTLRETEPEYYTDSIIKSLMLVLLSAGTDTSAGTIEWALSLLLNHPEIMKKAQKEINDNVGQDQFIQESDIAKLPYLRCIINETLRMYPAGPLLVPHESSQGCKVGGYNVPRGSMLLVNLWAIQNDPKLWEEPSKFMPERFQGTEGARDGYKLMPFGSGRRSCPGEGLANRVVGLTLGSLLQCFEWERIGEEMVDMSEGTGLTLPKARPLVAKCWSRPILYKLLS